MGYKWGQGHTSSFLLCELWESGPRTELNWVRHEPHQPSYQSWAIPWDQLLLLFLQEICFYRRIFSFSYLFSWPLLCTLRDIIPEGSKESEMYNLELSYFHFYPALCLPWYFANLEDFQEHSKFWDIWKPQDNREQGVIKGIAVQLQIAFISPWRRLFGVVADGEPQADGAGWRCSREWVTGWVMLGCQPSLWPETGETPWGKDGIFPCVVPQ